MKKKILILGGSGFIGRHLAEFLINKGWNVTVTTFSKKKIFFDKKIKIVNLDLVDLKKVKKFIQNNFFEYIVNLAGYIDHSSFYKKKNFVLESHFYGVVNLLKYLDKNNFKKFIQIGSSDEYGNLPAPQKENMREMPISLYSFSKLALTNFLQMLHRTENFPVIILRIFLAYGPGQDNNRFIPNVINGCIKKKNFNTSRGNQFRDFCYIDDVIMAIYMSLISTKNNGEIFNVGSGKPTKLKSLINKIVVCLKSGTPMFGKIKYRKNENMFLYPDISKIKKKLKWKAEIDISKGLKKTIHYYKNNNA